MTDLLIKLYDLPDLAPHLAGIEQHGVIIRRARTYEKFDIVDWVRDLFGKGWAGECDVTFGHQPVTCFLATRMGTIVGFGCYESTRKNFFGPLGVTADYRRKGIGSALMLRCLCAMAESGYGYAVIGDAGAAAGFYARSLEVIEIPGSSPGIYADRLEPPKGGD